MLRTKKTLNNLDRKWRFVRNEIVNIKYILTSLNYTAYHPDQKQVEQNNGGGQRVQCALEKVAGGCTTNEEYKKFIPPRSLNYTV